MTLLSKGETYYRAGLDRDGEEETGTLTSATLDDRGRYFFPLPVIVAYSAKYLVPSLTGWVPARIICKTEDPVVSPESLNTGCVNNGGAHDTEDAG